MLAAPTLNMEAAKLTLLVDVTFGATGTTLETATVTPLAAILFCIEEVHCAVVIVVNEFFAAFAAPAADPGGIVMVYATFALLPASCRPSLSRRRAEQVTVALMLSRLVTPLAALSTSFIAAVPFAVCILAHCCALAVSKLSEPVTVLVPVVGWPVVLDVLLLWLLRIVTVVVVAVAAVVVVALFAAEATTHSVSNHWRSAILRAGLIQMRQSCVPAETA